MCRFTDSFQHALIGTGGPQLFRGSLIQLEIYAILVQQLQEPGAGQCRNGAPYEIQGQSGPTLDHYRK